jgi:hypothetical protein
MTTYYVLLSGGADLQVTAARFDVDGSGTRFFDEADNLVAFWASGMVQACFPYTPPAEPPVA